MDKLEPCPDCFGQGKVLGQSNWYNCGALLFDKIEKCETCNGRGRTPAKHEAK